jgi:hypothetical protein
VRTETEDLKVFVNAQPVLLKSYFKRISTLLMYDLNLFDILKLGPGTVSASQNLAKLMKHVIRSFRKS